MTFKKKAEYIWDYYKWHIAIALCIVAVVSYTVYKNVTKPQYDVYVVYAGDSYYGSEFREPIELLAQYADDITGDGEKTLSFDQLYYGDRLTMEQYMTMNMTLEKMMARKENTVFLLDADRLDIAVKDGIEDLVLPLSDWTEGEGFAANLADSALLKGVGIDTDDLYIAVGKGKNNANAVKLARELIK